MNTLSFLYVDGKISLPMREQEPYNKFTVQTVGAEYIPPVANII